MRVEDEAVLHSLAGDGDVGAGPEGLLGPAAQHVPGPLATATPVVTSLDARKGINTDHGNLMRCFIINGCVCVNVHIKRFPFKSSF